MRSVLMLAAGLLGAGLVRAAPRSLPVEPPPPTKAALQEEAKAFAQQLLSVSLQVSQLYVRPVERADLLFAALSGVYDAARLPMPRDLRARIRKAEAADQARLRAAAEGGSLPPAPAALPGAFVPYRPGMDHDLAELISKVRIEVAASEFLEGQNVLLFACRALGRSLDPYTVPIEDAGWLNAEYQGIGLELEDSVAGRVKIRQVLPGSPAQRAGLRPGDVITHLDGKPAGERPMSELRARLQQVVPEDPIGLVEKPESTPATVEVQVLRPGVSRPRTMTLASGRFRPETVWGVARQDDNSWDYWLDRRRRIAHVRLGFLTKGTTAELLGVLTGLRDDGMKGLILDLRWCPGGFLDEALECAGLFVGAGATVSTIKSRRGEQVNPGRGQEGLDGFPIVLLVNGRTSGGGEMIAAALQDNGRVRVAGQRTLGKGTVQQPLSVAAGFGMKITNGFIFRPSGKNLHRFPESKETDDWGVRPDTGLEMRLSADLCRQLEQWWLWQTLRPGSSSEALPLDDPENDPQRQVALAALLEQIEPKVRAKGD
jgi:carboxyl-terminal processing protease